MTKPITVFQVADCGCQIREAPGGSFDCELEVEPCRYPALLEVAEGIRAAWKKSAVMNSAEWHAAALRLVQHLYALDERDAAKKS